MRNEEMKANELMLVIAGMAIGCASSKEVMDIITKDEHELAILSNMSESEYVARLQAIQFNDMNDDKFIPREYQVSSLTNAIDKVSEMFGMSRHEAKISIMIGAMYMGVKGSKDGRVTLQDAYNDINVRPDGFVKVQPQGIAAFYRNETEKYNR